jgi:hypothetical protein
VPVSLGPGFELLEYTVLETRNIRGIEERDPLRLDVFGQLAKKRQVVLSTKEYYLALRIVRKHSEIIIAVSFAAPFVRIRTLAKRYIVIGRQKNRFVSTPNLPTARKRCRDRSDLLNLGSICSHKADKQAAIVVHSLQVVHCIPEVVPAMKDQIRTNHQAAHIRV